MEHKLPSFTGWLITFLCLFALFTFHPLPRSWLSPAKLQKFADNSFRKEEQAFSTTKSRKLFADSTHLTSSKQALSKVLSLIRHRYEFDTYTGRQFMLTTSNMDETSWDILKFKFAHKILGTNQTFLMIFGGSSVTAGHDNYFNQSYPIVFERRLKKVFEELGIELIVHNIAQGANNCVPYIHCYESMGGAFPDFIGWEQSYNCGRDNSVFEAAARIVGWNELAGAAYFSASGAWLPKDCPPSPDKVPYCTEEWTPAAANLKDFEWNWDEVKRIREYVIKFNQGKASSARFTSAYHNEYKSVSLAGFNVWEQNPYCSVLDPKSNQNHSCNGIDAAQGCALKFMSQEATHYGSGHGANWHPSAAFHLLRGEFIVWLYGLILYDAIEMVEMELKTSSAEQLEHKYISLLRSLPRIPAPKSCNNLHCFHRAQCYTDFAPHFPKEMTLAGIIVGKHNWIYDDAELGDWSLKYGYLDAKPVYHAAGSGAGEIHIRLKVGDEGIVWICGGLKEAIFYVEPISQPEKFDGSQFTPNPAIRKEWKNLRDTPAGDCRELAGLNPEEMIFSIVSNNENHAVSLTHAITWPTRSKWHTTG